MSIKIFLKRPGEFGFSYYFEFIFPKTARGLLRKIKNLIKQYSGFFGCNKEEIKAFFFEFDIEKNDKLRKGIITDEFFVDVLETYKKEGYHGLIDKVRELQGEKLEL